MKRTLLVCLVALFALLAGVSLRCGAQADGNLLPDPSIEETQSPNQFGIPYRKWNGWIFEGAGTFRNGKMAHSGVTSAELRGTPGVKMRLYSPAVIVEPGRYRFSCHIRGLDIGVHAWGLSEDVNFVDGAYTPLKKSGTFGWTPLEIVKDVPTKQEVVFRIGLWAAGRLWVDDARLERVSDSVPLTNGPVLGKEEQPIAPPSPINGLNVVQCPDCGYRNMPQWKRCYACGEILTAATAAAQTPSVRPLASFEDGKAAPFAGSDPDSVSVEAAHATEGRYALRLNKGYAIWQGAQDWTGYDFLKADAYNPGDAPVSLYIEIRDQATQDYWTRVNYQTVLPPGASTLILPTDLYVGEKSRPGRPLDKAHITTFVLSISDQKAPIYFDNLRLERDLSDRIKVPGLRAFAFGPGTAPPLRGFTAVTPATVYSPGRGYGLKNAQIWKAYDALQPDPLYAVGICIEHGGFAVDLPNGKYHVFLNIDSPSGFWGEYQVYRKRTVKANGVPVVQDTMDLPRFLKKYFRFADVEDRPTDNTFDKYQRAYFQEKQFDAEVKDGQLVLEFEGEAWANYVSVLVIYPAEQAALGKKYLANLQERRRFYFDNYFKRVLPNGRRDARGAIPAFVPTPAEAAQGYALFVRDWMQDVPVNAVPRREETGRPLEAFANAGKLEPLVFSLYPLRDRGTVTLSVSDLTSAAGVVPASALQLGVVSHRLARVTGEGTVYTIAPRLIMPRSSAQIQKGTTITFWLTLHTPEHVKSGIYRGKVLLRFADGHTDSLPLSVRLYATPLDPLDVAAGPWGSSLSLPWYDDDLGDYRREMFRKSLARMRAYGCTTFSGIPTLVLRGWKGKEPEIDFRQADQEMQDARTLGFHSVVINYNGGIQGFNNYTIDEAAMKTAGFDNYVAYLRAILTAVDAHAKQAGWLPVAYNLCDEPIGDAAKEAAANARAWREAAPPDIITTGATSIDSATSPNDPHIELSRALRVANLNGHDEPALRALKENGGQWAFYNGGNRWTFGVYMFKCAQQYGMKWRLDWYWNAAAGDPYYALDCREDDYAWVVTNAQRELIPTLHFEREIREGIDDYRYMLTLTRLLHEKPDHPAAAAARQLLEEKLASFKLGERDHDTKWPASEYRDFRLKLAEAIERLSR